MSATETTWRGAAALEPFLVPIDELEPFEGNPRRGDVEAIRASIRRFGQVKAIVIDRPRIEIDGRRIVAGHHFVQAAIEEGWTHVAAIQNEFENEEEARAFLLADNRISDLGRYDDELLIAQLQATLDLEGTGYTAAEVAELDAQLRKSLEAPPEFPSLDPDDLHVDYECPSCHYQWAGSPRPGSTAG